MTGRVLCVVVCAAGPAAQVGRLVELARSDGWTVRIVATPAAIGFFDASALANQSGAAVRSEYRAPGEPGPRASEADAILIAPATYNTINKLAAGVNDNYALNVVAEAIGRGRAVVIMPFVNAALAARRPFRAAVDFLRSEGVNVVLGPGQWEPHQPGEGVAQLDDFPWRLGLDTVSGRFPAGR